MRALVIAPEPFFTPRGTPLSVYHRTAAMAELGVDVDLLTYGQGRAIDLPGVRIVRIPVLPFLREAPAGPSLTKLFLDLFIVAWAVALLLRHRYDMVHAHEEASFFCVALRPLLRFRLIYDMHSSLPSQLSSFRFSDSRLLLGLFRWLEHQALSRADAVITICPALAVYATEHGVAEERHFLIENSLLDPVRLVGGESSEPPPDVPEPPEGSELVVYAGTLEAYQGIDLLLEAVSLLAPRIPRLWLLVLGGTPDQVARYRRRAARLGLAERCRFAGRVPQQTARDWIARARVQISARIAGTNTPLKLYEQLASGVALLATKVHSHTQVLDDDVALLVEPEPQALADGLARLLEDAPLRAGLAERARRRYAERYSREHYFARMRALLQSLG